MKRLAFIIIVAAIAGFAFFSIAFSGDFNGTVTRVNRAAKTVTVRNGGLSVTFDISSFILKGYKNLSGIKVGDKISVGYTRQAVRITKGFTKTPAEEREKTVLKRERKGSRKASKEGRIRVTQQKGGTDFREVDVNEDGKITAVELSVVLPALNMTKFRELDKNGDGYLNGEEYNAAKTGLGL